MITLKYNEDRRLHTLHSLSLVTDTQSSEGIALVELAGRYFDVPMSIISLIDRDEQRFFARYGIQLTRTPRSDALYNFIIECDETQIVADMTLEPRLRLSALDSGTPFLRFYAGYPLRAPNGSVVGTFCLLDTKPRQFTDAERRDFERFGAIAEAMVFAHARDLALKLSQSDVFAQAQKLTRANSAMAQVARIAKIGQWEVDIKTMNVAWSEDVYRIHELDIIEGNSVVRAINYYAEYDRKRVNAAVKNAVVNGMPFDFTADLITAKGNLRHVRSAGERDDSGSGDSRVIGIIQDVTDVVRAQRQFAETEAEQRCAAAATGHSDG
jgi:PAS domain-containing protein